MDSFQKLQRCRRNALVIVAHPDDETLFMGGTIARYKRWRWTVLCVTDCDKRYNKRRRRELLRVCRLYRANGCDVTPHMLGIIKRNNRFSKQRIRKGLCCFLKTSDPFDLVFTHNKRGEYGHKTHKLIHSIVKSLQFKDLYYFSLPSIIPPSHTLFGRKQTVCFGPDARRVKRKALRIYATGSQKRNLSRLKKVVEYANTAFTESYQRDN